MCLKVIGLAQKKKKKKKLLVDNFELPGGHRAAPGRAGAWTTGQRPQAERCWRRHRPLLPRMAAHGNMGLAAKELSHLEEFKILLIQRKKLFVSIFALFFFFFSQEQRGTTLIPKRASSWDQAHRRGPVLGLLPPPPSFWLLQPQSRAVWCSGQAATSVTSRPHQTGTRSKVKLGSSPLVTRRQLHPWGALGSPQPGGEPGGDPWPVLGMLPLVAFCVPSPFK